MSHPGGDWPQNQPQQPQGGQFPPPQPGQQYQPPAPPPDQQYPQPGQQFPPSGPQPTLQQPVDQQGWQPQPGQPQPGQPYAGQPFPGQPGQPGQPWDPAYAGGVPPKKSRTGLIIGLVIALLVVAGGVGTYFALTASSGDPGSESPSLAAAKLVSKVSNNDAIGLIDIIAPAEAKLLGDLNTQVFEQGKRLNIVRPDADPKKASGVKVEGLHFDDSKVEKINDHISITKLDAGKITVDTNAADSQLSKDFVDKLFPKGSRSKSNGSETFDITRHVQRSGEPIRIATVKVGEGWYPSLFYSIADNALHEEKKSWPSSPIPAVGAGNPEDAVRQIVDAGLKADLRRVIELLPPDEMAVVHDAGPALLEEAGALEEVDASVSDLAFEKKDVPGGVLVKPTSFKLTVEGETGSVRRAGDCISVTDPKGKTEEICGGDLVRQVSRAIGLPSSASEPIERVISALIKDGLGVVATQVDGKWYVSPIRSVGNLFITVLGSLQASDLDKMLKGGR